MIYEEYILTYKLTFIEMKKVFVARLNKVKVFVENYVAYEFVYVP